MSCSLAINDGCQAAEVSVSWSFCCISSCHSIVESEIIFPEKVDDKVLMKFWYCGFSSDLPNPTTIKSRHGNRLDQFINIQCWLWCWVFKILTFLWPLRIATLFITILRENIQPIERFLCDVVLNDYKRFPIEHGSCKQKDLFSKNVHQQRPFSNMYTITSKSQLIIPFLGCAIPQNFIFCVLWTLMAFYRPQ